MFLHKISYPLLRILSILLLPVLSLCLLLAILSFDLNDPSFNVSRSDSNSNYNNYSYRIDSDIEGETGKTIIINRNNSNKINNWLGILGSYSADALIQLFGIVAPISLVVLFIIGIRFRPGWSNSLLSVRLLLFLLFVINLSILISSIYPGMNIWGFESYGGAVGLFANDLIFSSTPIYFLIAASSILTMCLFSFVVGFNVSSWMKAILFLFKLIGITFYIIRRLAVIIFLKCIASCSHGTIKKYSVKLKRHLPFSYNVGDDINDLHSTSVDSKKSDLKINDTTLQTDSDPTVLESSRNNNGKFGDVFSELTSSFRVFNKHHSSPVTSTISSDSYVVPVLDLLDPPTQSNEQIHSNNVNSNINKLLGVLQDFGVNGNIIGIKHGPVVTLYEFEPASGIKSSRIIGLSDDIARSMGVVSVRIAVVQGKNALGIELPNKKRRYIRMYEVLSSNDYLHSTADLPLALGVGIDGSICVTDLAKMPHLLIAGTTGSGKSVALNAIIVSLLYSLGPDSCRFVMIDPKMLEFALYNSIPHLLTPVVTDPKNAIAVLRWVVSEMERRYDLMSGIGVRNITSYNEKVFSSSSKKMLWRRQIGFNIETGDPEYEEREIECERLYYLVVIIDEMADLMIVAGKEIEALLQRLSQMARAAGIHLILATQRPSVNVVTGVIKANFPTRISFKVTSKIDSRTIIDEQGAEQLLGMGDMLYMSSAGRIKRVHGVYLSDDELERIVAFVRNQRCAVTRADLQDLIGDSNDANSGSFDSGNVFEGDLNGDSLYEAAVNIVRDSNKPSISYIQRRLRIGYNKAANLIERMEAEGIVSTPDRSGKREVL